MVMPINICLVKNKKDKYLFLKRLNSVWIEVICDVNFLFYTGPILTSNLIIKIKQKIVRLMLVIFTMSVVRSTRTFLKKKTWVITDFRYLYFTRIDIFKEEHRGFQLSIRKPINISKQTEYYENFTTSMQHW